MAFGKEREHLGAVTPFGANTSMGQRTTFLLRNQGEQRQKRGGGGMRFSDFYKPTQGMSFDTIRLVPGNYTYQSCNAKKEVFECQLEYFPFITHFDGRNNRSTICSGGVFHNFRDSREPCTGCELFFSTMENGANGKKKSRVSKQDKYAFNVLHYHPYHKIPQIGENGQVATNDKNEPYYEWVQCEGRGCKICPQNVETMEARMLKWEMSFTHFKAMTMEYSAMVGQGCMTCRSKKSISSLAWICPFTDDCGEAIIDMADTTLKDEDIARITGDQAVCPHCKRAGFLTEVFQCTGCSQPRRASIFDVNLHIKCMSAGAGDSKQTQLILSDWSEPCAIDPRFAELAKPFDLPKIYTPSTMEFQQKTFGEGAPAAGGGLQRTPVTGAPAPGAGFRGYQQNPPSGGSR